MTSDPLPRCRKCGGEPMTRRFDFYGPQNWVLCAQCGHTTGSFSSPTQAIKEWRKMNQPIEDHEEWVIQDRVPARPGIDERAWTFGDEQPSRWSDASYLNFATQPMHGHRSCSQVLHLRCRRKDLPAVKPEVHPMCAAMASAASTTTSNESITIVDTNSGKHYMIEGFVSEGNSGSLEMAPAGGPGHAGISDLVADLLTVTCPVTGELVKLSAEGRKFFSPWMNPDGTFKYTVPLIPKDGYRFTPRGEPVMKGDMWWDITTATWQESAHWRDCWEGKQGTRSQAIGPYIRKITASETVKAALIEDNGDNPNCGKPVEQVELRNITEAADRLLRSQMFVKDCDHIWNAHQQCQWCHSDRRSVDIALVAEAWKKYPPGSVPKSPVKLKDLLPIDKSVLPVIQRPLPGHLNDEQAAAWSALFQWCGQHGFESTAERYRNLTGLQTLAQWILDLQARAGNTTAPVTQTYEHQVACNADEHQPIGCNGCSCHRHIEPVPVHCGGPYVTREVFDRLRKAAATVVKRHDLGTLAPEAGNSDSIEDLRVALGNVLEDGT